MRQLILGLLLMAAPAAAERAVTEGKTSTNGVGTGQGSIFVSSLTLEVGLSTGVYSKTGGVYTNVVLFSTANAVWWDGVHTPCVINTTASWASCQNIYGQNITGGGALSGGTTPQFPYWTAANALGNSTLSQDSANSLTAYNSTVTVTGGGNTNPSVTTSSGVKVLAGTLLSAAQIQATASGNNTFSVLASSGLSATVGIFSGELRATNSGNDIYSVYTASGINNGGPEVVSGEIRALNTGNDIYSLYTSSGINNGGPEVVSGEIRALKTGNSSASVYTSSSVRIAAGILNIGAMTKGSVPFIGTGGDLLQNNANLFWDNSGLQMGLGIASPDATLDVRGSFQAGNNSTYGNNMASTFTANAELQLGNSLLEPSASTSTLTSVLCASSMTIASSSGTYVAITVKDANCAIYFNNLSGFSGNDNGGGRPLTFWIFQGSTTGVPTFHTCDKWIPGGTTPSYSGSGYGLDVVLVEKIAGKVICMYGGGDH